MPASNGRDPAAADAALLRWYGPRRSAFPWRTTADPYAVLVSEVMLQQTQAPRVAPAFERFVERFPSAEALAAAQASDVVAAWQGLGYNRRAVALRRAAADIAANHAGTVPSDPAALRRLPGVGPYTAAAVASIAFDVPVAAVDTNVRRIVERVWFGGERRPTSAVLDAAERWMHRQRPGEWNQALMDLGREVCRPVPRCDACPLRSACRAVARGEVPRAAARARQPAFEGSFRQLRGMVVRELADGRSASVARLRAATGRPVPEVARAIEALAAEGLVAAGPAAVAGRPSGRVRLAR